MSKMKRVIEQTFSMDQMLKLFDSVIKHSEDRMVKRVLEVLKIERAPEIGISFDLKSIKADRMRSVPFANLVGGSVFRLDAGTQPILKLELQQWGKPMEHNANAFYLRTGSTCWFPPGKIVVPLKCSITIDE